MQATGDESNEEAGLQFVLDTRRLLVGFVILVVLCGGFFILGFVEGKRQGVSASAAVSAPGLPSDAQRLRESQGPTGGGGTSEAPRRQVQDPATPLVSPPRSAPKPAESARVGTRAPEQRVEKPKPATPAGKAAYTVQVGAFRQRKEADTKSDMLRAKGYACGVDAPQAPDQLFLLMVGRFESRADAVAMQLRLKKDGFSSFVKSR